MKSPSCFRDYLLVPTIFLLFFSVSWLPCWIYPYSLDPEDMVAIHTIIDSIHNWEMEKAETLLNGFLKKNPSKPIGYFYKAYLYWQIIVEDPTHETANRKCAQFLQGAIDKGTQLIRYHQADYQDTYFYGLSCALMIRNYYKQSQWSDFVDTALKAWHSMQQVQQDSPWFVDAWFAEALILFYTDSLPESFKQMVTLIGIHPNQQKGLEWLETIWTKGYFIQPIVVYYLVNAYLSASHPLERTFSILEDCMHRYPNNLMYQRLYYHAYLRSGNIHAARNVLDQMESTFSRLPESVQTVWRYRLDYIWGSYFWMVRDWKKAGEAYKMALFNHQDHCLDNYFTAWALLKLAMIKDMQGEREQSIPMYTFLLPCTSIKPIAHLAQSFLEKPLLSLEDPRWKSFKRDEFFVP